MPIAADSADDRVEQITILTERLTDLLERELALFRERRPTEAQAHAGERDRLVKVYAEEMALFKHNRSLVDGAAPGLLARLNSVTARFREILSEHGQCLTAVRTVSEDMMKAVATRASASAKAHGVARYGNNAAMAQPRGAAPASLALNQVI